MIRPATPDDADHAAPLIQATIGSIGRSLTGARSDDEAASVLAEFFARPGNRLSFENTHVAEVNGDLAGLLVGYDGALAVKLDEPFRDRLRRLRLHDTIDLETGPGEFYLDTLVVAPAFRRRGLAKRLILASETEARTAGFETTALLVEESNEAAWRLYRSLGYEEDARRIVSGHTYAHLVRRLTRSES